MIYPEAIKTQAVSRKMNGDPIHMICKELGISRTSLYRWDKNPANHIDAKPCHEMTARDFNIMHSRLERQRQTIEILRSITHISTFVRSLICTLGR